MCILEFSRAFRVIIIVIFLFLFFYVQYDQYIRANNIEDLELGIYIPFLMFLWIDICVKKTNYLSRVMAYSYFGVSPTVNLTKFFSRVYIRTSTVGIGTYYIMLLYNINIIYRYNIFTDLLYTIILLVYTFGWFNSVSYYIYCHLMVHADNAYAP